MLVVDASAAIEVLAGARRDRALRARLGEEFPLHAPHLIDVEVLSALRRMVRRSALSAEQAHSVLRRSAELPIVRYPHSPLRARIWQLRDDLTAYDATYVALSEILEAPLITTDAHLARTKGHHAVVEAF